MILLQVTFKLVWFLAETWAKIWRNFPQMLVRNFILFPILRKNESKDNCKRRWKVMWDWSAAWKFSQHVNLVSNFQISSIFVSKYIFAWIFCKKKKKQYKTKPIQFVCSAFRFCIFFPAPVEIINFKRKILAGVLNERMFDYI